MLSSLYLDNDATTNRVRTNQPPRRAGLFNKGDTCQNEHAHIHKTIFNRIKLMKRLGIWTIIIFRWFLGYR